MPEGYSQIETSGRVIKAKTGTGSKSEHNATMLETDKGTFVLRRQGGHPFSDPELDTLVGTTIRCQGILTEHTLIMTTWNEVRPA